ncbi:hypothetical protein GH721_14180 [Kriegella sp. EG-1]|nr:hypothetical protein [Flavobacteriaceae bacterium EG-1]
MAFLLSLLQRTSTLKNIFVLFITSHLVLLAMMLYTFPVIHTQIKTKVFDLQTFGYSFETAKSILNNLNDQTTTLYLFPQLTLFDLFYPCLLALFLSSFLFRLLQLTSVENKKITMLILIPFVAMLFDYLENICIILLISKAINISETFVSIASCFTLLKGVLTSIAWVAILTYSIKWLKMKSL